LYTTKKQAIAPHDSTGAADIREVPREERGAEEGMSESGELATHPAPPGVAVPRRWDREPTAEAKREQPLPLTAEGRGERR
jgi:hypothetical protein